MMQKETAGRGPPSVCRKNIFDFRPKQSFSTSCIAQLLVMLRLILPLQIGKLMYITLILQSFQLISLKQIIINF